MKLYIANCSKQEFHFTYSIPEQIRPYFQHIRAGSQIVIDGDQIAVDSIINQHSVYGMSHISKVKKGFGGLAYSIDKPISVEAIENGFDQKHQDMIDRALEARKVSAVAADQIMSNKAQEMGLKEASVTSVEIVEEKRNAADTGEKLNQVIEVIHEGQTPRRGRPRNS